MRLTSPYADGGQWYRGNLHTHTTNSDGEREPQAVVDDYADRGYDFLMISDHDCLTNPSHLDSRGMVLIGGNEVTAHGPHLLHVNADRTVVPAADRQAVLDEIASEESFAILAHPNWHRTYDHYDQLVMLGLESYTGIEIYNGVVERLRGAALATDRWDQLLGEGRHVWGFANDDSHRADDVALGWSVVRAERRSRRALVRAMRRGSFYASTGVELKEIAVDGLDVRLMAAERVRWRVITDFGQGLHRSTGTELRWRLPGDFRGTYVRVEAAGSLGGMAWTQPLFVSV